MGMAITLKQYLDGAGVAYDVVDHPLRVTSLGIAKSADIAANSLAKAVLLYDDKGFVVAVLAGNHLIDLGKLKRLTGRAFRFAGEGEMSVIFRDCDRGAMPPVGAAYGTEVLVEDGLEDGADVYFEAGDHLHLVHMAGPEFARLMKGAAHGSFCQDAARSASP